MGMADRTAPFPVGSNGAISGWVKFKMAAGGHFEKNSDGYISTTRRPIDFVFVSRVRFSWTVDRTASFPVVFGRHFVNSYDHIFQPLFRIHVMYVHRPYFALGLYNDC